MYEHNTHQPISHFRAWRASKNFATDAEVKMLVNVPRWRPSGLGYDFWQRVLGPLTEQGTKPTTVAACIEAGKKIGLTAGDTQLHLRWLWTWEDQCIIAGQRYVATQHAPTGNANTAQPVEQVAPKGKRAKKAQAVA